MWIKTLQIWRLQIPILNCSYLAERCSWQTVCVSKLILEKLVQTLQDCLEDAFYPGRQQEFQVICGAKLLGSSWRDQNSMVPDLRLPETLMEMCSPLKKLKRLSDLPIPSLQTQRTIKTNYKMLLNARSYCVNSSVSGLKTFLNGFAKILNFVLFGWFQY